MPEDRTYHESNLCTLGPRPQIMTGLFLLLLREHFASEDNIEQGVFRESLFTQTTGNEDTTGILIEDANVWTPTRTQNRPGIVVKRNGWKHMKRLTLGGKTGTVDGNPQYVKLWRGSHTLFCISPEGGEAEILVAETYRFLMHFGEVFRSSFNLLQFELVDVGALSQIEETTKSYVVPVTVAYGWNEAWQTREHAPTDVRLSQIFETYIPDCGGAGLC